MSKVITRITSILVSTLIAFSSLGFGAVIDDLSTAMLVSHAQDTSGSSTDGKYGSSKDFNNLQDTKIVDGIKYYNTNYGLHTDKTVSNYAPDGRTFDLDLESWYVGENPADVGMVLDASGSMAWTTNTLEPLVLNPKMIDLEELKNSQKENDGYLTEEQVEKILKPENTDSSKILYDNYSYYVYESRPSVSEFVPLGFWEGYTSVPASSIGDLIGYYPFDGTLENKAVSGNSARVIADVNEGEKFTDTPPYKLSTPDYEDFSNDKHEEVIQLEKTANNGAILLDVNKEELLSDNNSFSLIFQAMSADSSVVTGNSDTDIVYIGDLNDTSKGFRFLFNKDGKLEVRYGTNIIKTFTTSITTSWQTFKFTFDGDQLKFYLKELLDTVDISVYDDLGEIDDFGIIVGGLFSGANYDGIKNLRIDNVYLFNNLLTDADVITLENGSHFGAKTSATVVSGNLNSFGDNIVGLYSFDDYSLKNQAKNKSTSATYIGQNNGKGFDRNSSSVQVAVKEEYSESNGGYKDKGKSLSLNNTGSKDVAVKLDAKPKSDKYTISFAIMINNTSNTNADANVLYVGDDQDNYYRAFRAGNSSRNHFRIKEKGNGANLCDLNGFFQNKSGEWQIVTYVVDGNTITPYKNGEKQANSLLTLNYSDDISIIVAGLWDNLYNRNDIFLDELYVYDEALTDENVKKLYEIVSGNNETKAYDSKGNVIATFTEDLAKSSDQSERRGWYYVNSGSGWDNVSDPDVATAKSFEGIKYESKMESSDHIYNHANIPSAYNDSEYEELKDSIKNADNDFEFKNLNKDKEMHIRFYIDDSNMLRCFFNSGGNTSDSAFSKNSKENGNDPECRTQCSVVYYKPDKEPIKAESLNTVLNNFRNQLQNFSEKSKLSAVRFSTDEVVVDGEDKERADYDKNLKTLMLLDWVSKNDDNNEYSTNLAYIRRGFDDSSTSTVDNLYNYYLTGGTNTWIGLKSFYDNLNTPEIQGDGNNKYLIIFTDGRDTLNGSTSKAFSGITDFLPEGVTVEDDSQMASAWANKLKNDGGYKIFCVMLSTGSVSETANPDEYNAAKTFLQGLASDKEYVYDPTDEDELQAAFDEILSQIAVPLSNYTVQDYIDPRFDLVTYTDDEERGTVLHLGAGGNIADEDNNHLAKVGNAIKESGATFYEYTTKDGKTANIYYDDSNDMYYLRWTDQNIPGSTAPIDTDEDEGYIDVWSSTIAVRAKQDFIGGNAVLTNGNDAGMNLVFSPQSLSDGKMLSDLSGTATSTDKGSGNSDNSYASKGFPRTTVNVRLLDVETNNFNDVIYLGEVVSPTQMLVDLEDDYMTDSYYLEYLSRYAYRIYGDSDIGKDGSSGKPLIDLLNKWLKINDKSFEKKSFTIPYMYLPDAQYDDDGKLIRDGDKVIVHNNSGTETNQKDILGILTYEWERTDPNFKEEDGKDITDDFVVNATDQIVYQLSMKFTPLKEDDISLQDDSYVFITKKDEDTTYLNRSDLFFDIVDGEFTEAKENDAHNAGWTFYNRSEYNGALVVDNSYEWDSICKSTQGYEQIESYQDYGDGQITDEGFSLSAETIYTKDVVNAGLALELLVKGSDLTGGNITEGKTYTFTATRKYDDPFDPDPYGDTLGADRIVDGEQYQLTFTIDKSTIPGSIDNDTYYSIWAKLTGVKKGDEELSTKGLPIGTYTLALDDLNDEDLTVKDDVQFKILTAESPSNPEKFEAKLFPEDVTNKSNSNPDYNIADDTKAKQNVAEVGKSSNTATFYFGTTKDGINKGNRENPASDYVKDRLGIIVLTYGDNSLSISKEVTNTDDSTNLEREWEFLVTLTKTVGAGDEGDILTYNAKKTDKDGNVIGDTTTVTFTESGTESGIYTAEIKLKSGEKLTILQLPSGYQYTVQEIIDPSDSWKYTPYIGTTDNRTNVSADELLTPASSVHFINQFNTAELPSAGGSGTSWYIISGSVLMFIGLATLFIAQRKMRRQKV